jgi:uncharacterized DUF497 family protein
MSNPGKTVQLEIGGLKFSWDKNKALANEHKHGVTFEEAVSCWIDPFSIEFDDPDHSLEEPRWLLLGMSKFHRLLICWFTEKIVNHQEIIRLIGARKPTPTERKRYEEKQK